MNESTAVLIQITTMLVFGIICAAIAHSRGRSGVGWFFVGVFGGCIGLIVLLVLPDAKKEQARFERQAQENRRLREQLRKDRQVADQRHAGVERRLGTHDRAIGIDTSAATAGLGGEEAAALPPPVPEVEKWFYARDNQRHGPVTESDLRQLIVEGTVREDTLVWCQGMTDWQQLAKVPGLGADAS